MAANFHPDGPPRAGRTGALPRESRQRELARPIPYDRSSEPKERDHRQRTALAAILAIAVASLIAGGRHHADAADDSVTKPAVSPRAREGLVREFEGAYPREAEPNGTLREFHITAAPATTTILPGRPLAAWAYNGQVPGPTLRIKLGETVRVHFHNQLPEPSTIHWHGVRLPNAMDGVPGVTQAPVPSGGSFIYEFTPKDAGTFWFHPHLRSSEQVERGLFGVLVVEDKQPTSFSRELVWVVDDWLLQPDGSLVERFVTPQELAHDGRWGNVITMNGTPEPSVPVRPGERLRIRMLNVANARVFDPRFIGVTPAVIAMDGMPTTEPVAMDRIDLAPGNRVDFAVVVPTTAAGRTIDVVDGFSRARTVLARLVVEGTPVATPEGTVARGRVPDWAAAAGIPPDLVLHLNARRGGPFGLEWTISDTVMRHGTDEGMTERLNHEEYSLPLGGFAKIRFVNESSRLHPMHMHGVFFKVLARNGVVVDEPRWRDTLLMRARETLEIGLVPLDEGDWMLHCHILEHAESGMMTLVKVASTPPTTPTAVSRPESHGVATPDDVTPQKHGK